MATRKLTGAPPAKDPQVGRPTKYEARHCDELMAYFAVEPTVKVTRTFYDKKKQSVVEAEIDEPVELPTLAGFAAKIGVCKDTLQEWQSAHPEFSVSVKRALAHQERILLANGLAGRFHPAVSIFGLKNLAGWHDKQEREHSAKVCDPIAELLNSIATSPGGGRLKPPGG